MTIEEVAEGFELLRNIKHQRDFEFPVETRPTTPAITIYLEKGEPAIAVRRWWLLPRWAKESKPDYRYPMFNAKSESIHEKNAFRAPFKTQRCILPARCFFEFTPKPNAKAKDKKDQWRIEFDNGEPLWIAGLWEWWEKEGKRIESCTLVTTEANEFMAGLPHERMPVILAPDNFDLWLDPEITAREPLEQLFRPWDGEPLKKTLVTT